MDKTAFIYIHGVRPDLKTADIWGYSEDFHKKILKELRKLGKDTSRIKRFEINWSPVTYKLKTELARLQFDVPPSRRGFLRNVVRNLVYPAVIDILYYVKDKGSKNAPGIMLIMEKLSNAVKRDGSNKK